MAENKMFWDSHLWMSHFSGQDFINICEFRSSTGNIMEAGYGNQLAMGGLMPVQ